MFVETRQIKVVIVGKENVGKTSIVKRMKNEWGVADTILGAIRGKGSREATDGIEIHTWNPKGMENVGLHLWDFAGQVSDNCINNDNSFRNCITQHTSFSCQLTASHYSYSI